MALIQYLVQDGFLSVRTVELLYFHVQCGMALIQYLIRVELKLICNVGFHYFIINTIVLFQYLLQYGFNSISTMGWLYFCVQSVLALIQYLLLDGFN